MINSHSPVTFISSNPKEKRDTERMRMNPENKSIFMSDLLGNKFRFIRKSGIALQEKSKFIGSGIKITLWIPGALSQVWPISGLAGQRKA